MPQTPPAASRLIALLTASTLAFVIFLLWSPLQRTPNLSAQGGNPIVFIPLENIQQIAAGGRHTCALTAEGGVKCWGSNFLGQLGDGTNSDKLTPVDVIGLNSSVSTMAGGLFHTCAVTTDGGVQCWGNNIDGQLGDGTSVQRQTPVNVTGLAGGVKAVVAGGYHTCALTNSGAVHCWGYNGDGQLGDATFVHRQTPVAVSGLNSGVLAITAGFRHTCALLTNGNVQCWGLNDDGQLGDNTTTASSTPVNSTVLGVEASSLAAGYYHTCALTTANQVKCWGLNGNGQLGGTLVTAALGDPVVDSSHSDCLLAWHISPAMMHGASTDCRKEQTGLDGHILSTPPPNAELAPFLQSAEATTTNIQATALAPGGYHTCVLTANGGAQCWGGNFAGQLGDSTNADRATPGDVVGLSSGAHALVAGQYHTCALLTDGTVQCWGLNSGGQLGDSNAPDDRAPVDVAGLGSGASTLATRNAHVCALITDGNVKCWGWNGYGQLGDGTTLNHSTPVSVVGLSNNITTVATGGSHTCVLTNTGGVKCWGNNTDGELGDGTTTNRTTPVDVVGLSSGVKAIVAGGFHTCALTSGGGVKCWGYNGDGQLGDSTTTGRFTPVDVVGLTSGVKALIAGNRYTCALTSGGGVKCWGQNDNGQLGDGTTNGSSTPVNVTGLTSGIKAIAGNYYHTCALTTEGGVKCWGYNADGELGDGTTNGSSTPVDVTGLNHGVSMVMVGGYHTCAILNSGSVQCWGYNGDGQLGDATNTDRYSPTDVVGLNSTVSTLALGAYHTCILTTGGGVKCWGWSGDGQLGDGTAWRLTPVTVMVAAVATSTPTSTNTPTSIPSATPTSTATHTLTPTPTKPGNVPPTATSTPTASRTPPGGNTNRPLYLSQVIRANTPTPTVTPNQPIWQRVGQGGIVFTSLAAQGNQLFAGARDDNHNGGLYTRDLVNCTTNPDFSRVGTVNATTLLGVAFQGTRGAASAFDANVFYSSDGGATWAKTQSAMTNPRTVVLASGGLTGYAGTEENGIYDSNDGGHTWQQRRIDPNAINRIRLDAKDDKSLWVATEKSGVWILTIGTNRLVQNKAGLSSAGLAVWDFAFDSGSSIYLATYDGVYIGNGVNAWQPIGLQGKELLSLTIQGDSLYAGGRNQGSGVWRRALSGGDWVRVTSAGWNESYIVRDLLYADACQGLLAATDDGVWFYR